MEFETVERCGRIYVVKNGVESAAFATAEKPFFGAGHRVYHPGEWSWHETLDEALEVITGAMDNWYTIAQAAERLVELGARDAPPSAHTMANLARAGAFPGAFKLRGKSGGGGQGGAWRIPGAALMEFAERRKGGRDDG